MAQKYFDDWLVSFEQQDCDFFYNNKKSYHSKHIRNHIFMTSTWKKNAGGGS